MNTPKAPPRAWLAIAEFPREFTGLESDEWFFQQTDAISLKPSNECDVPYVSEEEVKQLIAEERAKAFEEAAKWCQLQSQTAWKYDDTSAHAYCHAHDHLMAKAALSPEGG